MDAYKLFTKHSMEELVAMDKEIRADKKNQIPTEREGFCLYKPYARQKLDAIARAIAMHLRAKDG